MNVLDACNVHGTRTSDCNELAFPRAVQRTIRDQARCTCDNIAHSAADHSDENVTGCEVGCDTP
jgi:hypothetical protein